MAAAYIEVPPEAVRILALANVPLDPALGSGYVVLGFAEGLRARGHEVRVVGPEEFEPGYRFVPGRAVHERQCIGMARAALAEVQHRRWDIVELYGAASWLAADLLLGMGVERPLVVLRSNGFEPHVEECMAAAARVGLVPTARGRTLLPDHGARYARVLGRADGVVTVSDWDRDWAASKGLAPSDRLAAIPNPLPDEYLGLDPPRARPHVFGYCGNWTPRKGAWLLERAVPEILRLCPSWRFALLGVPSGERVRAELPTDVRGRIDVLPSAPRETALRDRYCSLSVLLMSSIYESFGLVAAEAMACGCALVATRVGFPASLQDGVEAELLDEMTAESLVERVVRLLESPDRLLKVADAGQRRVQILRWERALDEIEDLYASWLSVRSARSDWR